MQHGVRYVTIQTSLLQTMLWYYAKLFSIVNTHSLYLQQVERKKQRDEEHTNTQTQQNIYQYKISNYVGYNNKLKKTCNNCIL